MKKRIRKFLLMVVIAAVSVVLVGVMLKEKKKETETDTEMIQTEEAETTGEVLASESEAEELEEYDEEAEYFAQLEKDRVSIKDGNIFPRDSYPVYNGCGYRIKNFKLFDSFEDFITSEYCNEENILINPITNGNYTTEDIEKFKFAYAEVEVSNEGRYEKEFLLNDMFIILAEDGAMANDDYSFL